MKKIKILLILLGILLLSIILGGIVWKFTKDTSNTEDLSELAIIAKKNIDTKDESLEIKGTEEIPATNIEESQNIIVEENQEIDTISISQTSVSNNKNYDTSTSNLPIESSLPIVEDPIVTNDEPIEQNTNENSNIPVEIEDITPQDPTPPSMGYWCVEGGSHHILGDGPNEHGYYSTWDEAFNAFETYTSDWGGGNFKVDQCACGLYYFWAKQ